MVTLIGHFLIFFYNHLKLNSKVIYKVNCVQKLNENKIISGSRDQTIKVWDLSTGLCCNTLEGNGSAMCIQLLSDERIICGYDDWSIKVWDLDANDCLKV